MSKPINPDLIRLKDILNAIVDIEGFIQKASLDDRMALMAVAYEIAIIGEAASKISDEFQKQYDYIPWKNIIGMRHRIIHDYGNISVDRLKEVVTNYLPILKQHILAIIT